ncbi:MAG TPA: fatty acid desaturase, partial [Thermoanaerobaculia bacterium]|nr:fatty acid desaturase [Thermoanaerobaculia bacterium]
VLAPYKQPDTRRAILQVLDTAIPFVALWALMLASLQISYALTLLLAVPTAGLLVRLFIIQHDCGHGSFFPSQRANHVLGGILGVVTLTPYRYWRRTHAIHHATSGNLDRRELGDVLTKTVGEYRSLGFWGRLGYRLYRHPVVLLVFGPAWQFLIKHRLPFDAPRSWKSEWASVLWTNFALAALVVVMAATVGIGPFLLVWTPVFILSGAAGVWLFYVQHQFEDTYWERQEGWDFHLAGIEGSSFYDLPAVAHWFTGNIGFHHVHHLSSKIPNYRLRQCMAEVPDLQHVTRLKFVESLACLRLTLWDEETRKLVRFRDLRTLPAREAQAA